MRRHQHSCFDIMVGSSESSDMVRNLLGDAKRCKRFNCSAGGAEEEVEEAGLRMLLHKH